MLHCEPEVSYGHATSLVWMQQSLGVTLPAAPLKNPALYEEKYASHEIGNWIQHRLGHHDQDDHDVYQKEQEI